MGFLFSALAGGFLFFQTQATPQKAAAKLEKALRRKFPDAKIQVEVEGKRGLNVISGKFGLVKVRMEGFKAGANSLALYAVPVVRGVDSRPAHDSGALIVTAPVAVPSRSVKTGSFGKAIVELRDFGFETTRIDEADIEVNELVYDFNALTKRGQLAIVSAGPGSSRIRLGETSLESIVKFKLPQVQNPRVNISGGLLHLSGSRAAPIIGTPINFSISAKPVARGGELWAEEVRMSLGGANLPQFVSNSLLYDLNPVFVFNPDGKLPFRVVSSNIVMHEKAVEFLGSLAFVPVQAQSQSQAPKSPPQESPKVR